MAMTATLKLQDPEGVSALLKLRKRLELRAGFSIDAENARILEKVRAERPAKKLHLGKCARVKSTAMHGYAKPGERFSRPPAKPGRFSELSQEQCQYDTRAKDELLAKTVTRPATRSSREAHVARYEDTDTSALGKDLPEPMLGGRPLMPKVVKGVEHPNREPVRVRGSFTYRASENYRTGPGSQNSAGNLSEHLNKRG